MVSDVLTQMKRNTNLTITIVITTNTNINTAIITTITITNTTTITITFIITITITITIYRCDSGVKPQPDAPGDNDYSAILFAREAQRLIRAHPRDRPLFM